MISYCKIETELQELQLQLDRLEEEHHQLQTLLIFITVVHGHQLQTNPASGYHFQLQGPYTDVIASGGYPLNANRTWWDGTSWTTADLSVQQGQAAHANSTAGATSGDGFVKEQILQVLMAQNIGTLHLQYLQNQRKDNYFLIQQQMLLKKHKQIYLVQLGHQLQI